eukprot:Seg1629.7 transcript_id=Seg1629.7/GoldUCD/mRNA.D3Y31 product="hypothetical protein" pseudo=true protein_id=Seg1629.7/GoldUCD/D3Y31
MVDSRRDLAPLINQVITSRGLGEGKLPNNMVILAALTVENNISPLNKNGLLYFPPVGLVVATEEGEQQHASAQEELIVGPCSYQRGHMVRVVGAPMEMEGAVGVEVFWHHTISPPGETILQKKKSNRGMCT